MQHAVAVTALAILTSLPLAASAQSAADHSQHLAAQPAAKAPSALTDGEVRKVDKSAKSVTLKHGAIVNLQMPPMTMMFDVKDASMLDRIKAGDKVRFAAEDVAGRLTITRLEPAR